MIKYLSNIITFELYQDRFAKEMIYRFFII